MLHTYRLRPILVVLVATIWLSIPSPGFSTTLDIPAISGVVKGAKGVDFENLELRIHWFCMEDTFMPMVPTGEKRCGGLLGKKSGTQVVGISEDGGFTTSPILVKRFGPFRRPRFYLKFGLFKDGEKLQHLSGHEYSRMYITDRDGDVPSRVRQDLSQLRVVRVRGGEFPIRIAARDSDGSIVCFSSLMTMYPDSYNYSSRVILWIDSSVGSSAEVVSFDVVESAVIVPDFQFLQVGSDTTISMSAQVTASIGLVKEPGMYKYYTEESSFTNLSLVVNQNLEATLDGSFLDSVNILIEIE